jgi:hypothetical protein
VAYPPKFEVPPVLPVALVVVAPPAPTSAWIEVVPTNVVAVYVFDA